jgi:LysR family glycine cleavage system transcriptional activator
MRELPLVALRAFASVYSNRGIRAAARELNIAHSSVSRHVTELSAWLGVALVRDGGGRRQMTFTPQGEELGRAALAAMRQLDSVVGSIKEAKSSRSVTISTSASFATRWLLPRLPALEKAHPRIEPSLIIEQKLDDLGSGEIDLAIRMGRGDWPDVHCEPLMNDALYPVMSPAFWKKAAKPDKPAELAGVRLLHDRDPHASWELWRAAFGPKSLDVRSGQRFASSDLVLRAAIQGQGVALARHQLAADEIASGALIRPIAGLQVDIGPAYWIVMAPRLRLRAAVAAVVAWLKLEAKRALI